MTEYIAHVSEDKSRFHLLEDHLIGVADLASVMAAEFGASGWAHLAGFWHDLGKYSHEFQSMIRSSIGSDASTETKSGRVDHSTAGGIHAVDRFGGLYRVFAYIITGHNAGLL